MVNTLGVIFGFATITLVLGAVLGVVEGQERYPFVAGVVLLALGPVLATAIDIPELLSGLVAVSGVVAIVVSTVPLLRQSPTTS